MSEPVRRRLAQPSAEKAKRSGCLLWGAVLGVLVGIMVGIYALPPILKHYYGEEVIGQDEFYRGDGKLIRLLSVMQASDPVGDATPGMHREDFYATVVVVVEESWRLSSDVFSLEFEQLDEWQVAEGVEADIQGPEFVVAPGAERELYIHFKVELPLEEVDDLTPQALHLSDPRVKFEVPR